MRLLLYTGKGGVGKTTTAASTAVTAAARGQRTLVLSADAAHSLGDVVGHDLSATPEPVRVAPRLDAFEVDARVEMGRHWGSIRDYLVALFRYQGIEEVIAEELALLPGAEELAALLAMQQFVESGDYDLVVIDCAPTDATLRLLTLPEVAHGALRLLLQVQRSLAAVATPLAQGVVPLPLPGSEVFRDAERLLYRKLRVLRRHLTSHDASVRLVVTPERMVIDEARRAYTELCLFGLACDAVVINRWLPDEALGEIFFRDWGRLQVERAAEVEAAFAPLRILRAPLGRDEVVGIDALALHGAELFADGEPQDRMSDPGRMRFRREARGEYCIELPLPGARAETLDVAKVEAELIVRAGTLRRAIQLPRRIAPIALASARLRDGVLAVRFVDEVPGVASSRPSSAPAPGA